MKKILVLLIFVFSNLIYANNTTINPKVLDETKNNTIQIINLVKYYDENKKEILSQPLGTGTGVILKNNFIITNHHVIEEMDSATILQIGSKNDNKDLIYAETGVALGVWSKKVVIAQIKGDKLVELKVIEKAPKKDLALLKFPDGANTASGFEKIMKSENLKESVKVHTLGYPGADGGVSEKAAVQVKYTEGTIKAVTVDKLEGAERKVLNISAPISGGNSGGPVFNNNGVLLGINTFLMENGQNANFSVAMDEVIPLLDKHNVPYVVVVPTKYSEIVDYLKENPLILGIIIVLIVILIILFIVMIVFSKKAEELQKPVIQVIKDSVIRKKDSGYVGGGHTDISQRKNSEAVLSFEKGEVIGKIYVDSSNPKTIGRDRSNGVVYSLEKSPNISSNHCKVYFDRGGTLIIEDYSTNGCMTLDSSGEKIKIHKTTRQLREKDVIYIGSADNKFVVERIK